VVDLRLVRQVERHRQPALLRVRHVAGLIRSGAHLRPVLLVLALTAAIPAMALAADPTPGPPAGTPTCAERYPEDGPAGVDLRLGCVVSELVGLYTTGQAAPPPPLSAYVVGLGIAIAVVAGLLLLAGRLLARRAGQRLAPVTPGEWWLCSTCRSVNGTAAAHCYSCGSSRSAGPSLLTDDQPATPQSFGRGKHG
jgi:hypothetical protein